MYETLLKAYHEKKNKKNERRIKSHFFEEDSRNRVNPWRLQGSNPYLIWNVCCYTQYSHTQLKATYTRFIHTRINGNKCVFVVFDYQIRSITVHY